MRSTKGSFTRIFFLPQFLLLIRILLIFCVRLHQTHAISADTRVTAAVWMSLKAISSFDEINTELGLLFLQGIQKENKVFLINGPNRLAYLL